MKVSKTRADGKHLYINILDFKDEVEWDLMYKKIDQLVRDSQVRLKVY